MFRHTFVAFRVPAYRWLLGSSLSQWAALAILSLAEGWLVLQLTDSPFWLGATAGVSGAMAVLFSIPAGALADKLDRRGVLIVSLGLDALVAAVLALFVLTETVRLWHVLGAVALNGIIGAITTPVRLALASDVIGVRELLNANGFNSVANGLVAIAGALGGGLMIEGLGIGPAYVFVCIGLLGSAAFLLALQSRGSTPARNEAGLEAMKEGLRYAVRTPQVRRILLLSIITEAFGTPAIFLAPAMARDVLQVGASGFGYLTAMGHAGGTAAGVLVAFLGDFRRKEWLLLGGAAGFGLSIVLFGLSRWFLVSLGLMTLIGGTGGLYDATMMTMLQSTVPAAMRGRVLSLYAATWGANRLGGFGVGAIAVVFSAPVAIVVDGGIAAANALRLVPSVAGFRGGAPAPSLESPTEE